MLFINSLRDTETTIMSTEVMHFYLLNNVIIITSSPTAIHHHHHGCWLTLLLFVWECIKVEKTSEIEEKWYGIRWKKKHKICFRFHVKYLISDYSQIHCFFCSYKQLPLCLSVHLLGLFIGNYLKLATSWEQKHFISEKFLESKSKSAKILFFTGL